ncbi:HAD-IIIC family phosphatase [Streptomyces sp. NPDC048479]|uniref:HAD-IIIC family phosphatase n=1 Tax=Streptomyces sp. NPDC048479 TaxID=3154725 RepID=UPI00342C586E
MTTTERTAADTTAHTTPRTAFTAAGDSGTWRDPGALRTLRSAYAAGRLEAEYGSVRALLTRLPESDLPAAGQLLARLDREAVARLHPDLPVVTVAVTGQSTVAPLVGPLTAQLARHGLLLDPVVSPYGSYLQDLLGPARSGDGARQPLLTLCLLDPHTVFEQVPMPWRVEDVEAAARDRLALLGKAVNTHQDCGRGLLVLNTVPLLHHHAHQLVDLRSRARLGAVWREFNSGLLALAQEHPGVVVVDLDPLVSLGTPAYEPRTGLYAKARLAEGLLSGYAREVGHLVLGRLGRTRKCLVLDLDGTLWGGVLGEEGPDGIELGAGFRGEAFLEFQRVLAQLGSQGVLLAVSSKNDAGAVREVLRDHPSMLLREDDFVCVNANWSAKHDNLRDISERLGLGLDSFVFVDDTLFECGLVREQLPEVAVVHVDQEPALHPSALLADGWFDLPQLTEEDRERTGRYRTEARRQEFREDIGSYQDYLDGLGIEVTVRPADPSEAPRVSQLTLRTNQFHLATARMQVPQVLQWAGLPGHSALVVSARDRFGDHGLVGAVFLRRDAEQLRIDNFVLSCRVFSRGIESGCLSAVLDHARATGARATTGRYLPTSRNAAFSSFYTDHGFTPAGPDPYDPDVAFFHHDLRDIAPAPAHLRLHTTFEGDRT